jgi:hypothetical protein
MGEARRRRLELEATRAANVAWRDGLSPDQQAIANAAMRLHVNFIRPNRFAGGCYLLAFFLRRYLRLEHGLDARAVVGYVCDGTTPLRVSHAWLEYLGKKTDVSLTITEFPEHQPPGDLIVLDRILSRGVASYTYHLTESPESLAIVRESSAESASFKAMTAAKDREHSEMLVRANNDDAMEAFLAKTPPDVSYRVMAAAIQIGPGR